jgi:hypothetical protein
MGVIIHLINERVHTVNIHGKAAEWWVVVNSVKQKVAHLFSFCDDHHNNVIQSWVHWMNPHNSWTEFNLIH